MVRFRPILTISKMVGMHCLALLGNDQQVGSKSAVT